MDCDTKCLKTGTKLNCHGRLAQRTKMSSNQWCVGDDVENLHSEQFGTF